MSFTALCARDGKSVRPIGVPCVTVSQGKHSVSAGQCVCVCVCVCVCACVCVCLCVQCTYMCVLYYVSVLRVSLLCLVHVRVLDGGRMGILVLSWRTCVIER